MPREKRGSTEEPRKAEGVRSLPCHGKDRCGLMKGSPRGAGLAGESGGVAGRGQPPGASGPDHAAGRRDDGRKRAQGKGAGRGRAVWPQGRQLKLNTGLWRERLPFSSAPPLPSPPSFLLIPRTEPRAGAEGARGEEKETALRGQLEPGKGREGKGSREQK